MCTLITLMMLPPHRVSFSPPRFSLYRSIYMLHILIFTVPKETSIRTCDSRYVFMQGELIY